MLNGKLRLAKDKDLEELASLIYTAALDIPNGPEPDEERIKETLRVLIPSDIKQAVVVVYEVENTLVGFIVGIVNPNVFSCTTQVAELGYYVLPEYSSYKAYKELLETYESWAKDIVGANLISVATYNPRFGKVYHRNGYKLTETSYVKEI